MNEIASMLLMIIMKKHRKSLKEGVFKYSRGEQYKTQAVNTFPEKIHLEFPLE